MNKLLSSLMLAAGLVASAAAGAATYDLGGVENYGIAWIGPNPVSGSFSDTLDFYDNSFSEVSISVAALNVVMGQTTFAGINNLNVTLYNSDNVALYSGTNFTLGGLPRGNYYAVVTGQAFGTSSAWALSVEDYYGGAIRVMPVPEADIWTMMLAGPGMLGYVATRRRAGRG